MGRKAACVKFYATTGTVVVQGSPPEEVVLAAELILPWTDQAQDGVDQIPPARELPLAVSSSSSGENRSTAQEHVGLGDGRNTASPSSPTTVIMPVMPVMAY